MGKNMTVNTTPEFVLGWSLEAQADTHTLLTAGTYVDKNIKIDVNAKDAEISVTDGALTPSHEITQGAEYTTETETGHQIVIDTKTEKAAGSFAVTDEGWITAEKNATIAADEVEETITLNIKKGALTGSGNASAQGGNGLTLGDELASAPTQGFYVQADAAGSVKVGTAGWMSTDTAAVSTSGTAYYPINELELSNAGEDGQEYTEVTAPVLTSDGYLYLTEGYRKNTKISLATLVPDDATISAEDGSLIYHDETAYDKDGKLIVGTMKDVRNTDISLAGSDAEATVDVISIVANDAKDAFVVTGTADITGTATATVNKTGYIEKDVQTTGNITGEATVDTTLDVITIGADIADAETVQPTLAKVAGNAADGDITTDANQKGEWYVSVKSNAVSQEITVTPKVTGAGYGTADVHTANEATATVGAVESDIYYVPIKSGSVEYSNEASTVVAPVITLTPDVATTKTDIDASGVLASAPSGDYITISAATTTTAGSVKTGVTTEITEGYQAASTKTNNVTEAVVVEEKQTAKYIKVYDGSFN